MYKLNKIGVFLIIFLVSGCGVKEYQLFKNDDPSYISEAQEIDISYDSKIMPDDILNIDIYNMNQKSNILKDSSLLSASSPKENNQYIISADGTIYLPLLEEVRVQGLTIKELNKLLTQGYKKYLKQPYIKTSIKNHKVYVLGEVGGQGVVPIEGNTISIIEAITKAGGLTDYAVRDRIRVISQEDNKYKIRTLDLTQLSTLNMDNLMLRHNSIVYVEPKGSKAVKVVINDYLPIIQAISAISGTFLTIDYISNGN